MASTYRSLLRLRETIAIFAPFLKISPMIRGMSAYIPHLLLTLLSKWAVRYPYVAQVERNLRPVLDFPVVYFNHIIFRTLGCTWSFPPVFDIEPAPEDGPAVTSMRTRRRANVGKMEHTRYQGQQSLGTYYSSVPRSALFPVIVERVEKEVDQ